jgi:hypothetical protein
LSEIIDIIILNVVMINKTNNLKRVNCGRFPEIVAP